MSYNIAVEGYRDFARTALSLGQQTISRDPLSGVVDGSNNLFHTNYFPILTSGSMGVYVNGSIVPATADYNTGEVTLATAPSYQPRASYTLTPYTSYQILQFLMRGFDEMEGRYNRGWKLVTTTGSAAIETSDAIYIVDSNGNDPVTGSTTFSTSRAQIAFFQICCEYAFMSINMRYGARQYYMWRETVRGMTVDKSMMPKNMDLALARLEKDLLAIMGEAVGEYENDAQYGGAILGPVTLGYLSMYEWQAVSKEQDFRNTAGYHYGLRPTTYP